MNPQVIESQNFSLPPVPARTVSEEIYYEMRRQESAAAGTPPAAHQIYPLLLLQECCDILDKLELDFILPDAAIALHGAGQGDQAPQIILLHRGYAEGMEDLLTFRHLA